MPAIELFKYMDMELEKERNQMSDEKTKMYINYLSNIFSQPIFGKPSSNYLKAKKQFEQLIMNNQQQEKQKTKIYEWDFERERRLNKEGGK